MKRLLAGLAVLLAGCAHTYHPAEYKLSANRIGDFPTSGPVTASNVLQDGNVATVYDGGWPWSASMDDISHAISSQLQEEINRHSHPGTGPGKTLSISLLNFGATSAPYTYNTGVTVRVVGGGGFQKLISFHDTSYNGTYGSDLRRSFNSAIALCVVKILSDPTVLNYLKQP